MPLTEITDKSSWNDLAINQPTSVFLQSWEWGEFNRALSRRVLRLADMTKGKISGAAQCIISPLKLGKHSAYAPHGPIIDQSLAGAEAINAYANILQQLAMQLKHGSMFLRIDPKIQEKNPLRFTDALKAMPHQRTPAIQPADTRLLDLSQSEEQLLAAMHQKTRYNIRLAEKKEVEVLSGKQYLGDFLRLNKETTERDDFHSHPNIHYELMVELLSDSMLTVYAARFNNKIIAANLVVHFGNTTTYLHGASASLHRDVMAPHLLQWRQILDAKQRGCHWYDFWGIAPEQRQSPKSAAWEGITRFKNGFGGEEINYLGAYDLPLQKFWYTLYHSVRRVR